MCEILFIAFSESRKNLEKGQKNSQTKSGGMIIHVLVLTCSSSNDVHNWCESAIAVCVLSHRQIFDSNQS